MCRAWTKLFLLWLLLLPFSFSATEKWQRHLGDTMLKWKFHEQWGHLDQVVAALDGGFFTIGYGSIDGGYPLVVHRFDAHGNLLWRRTYGSRDIYSAGMVVHADGSFTITAWNLDPVINDQDGEWAVHCAPSGEVLSQRHLDYAFFYAASRTLDDKALQFEEWTWPVIKFDPVTGEVLWARGFYRPIGPGGASFGAIAVVGTADGGAAVLARSVAYQDDGVHRLYILKLDKDGHLEWSRTFNNLDLDGHSRGTRDWRKFVPLPDGGMVFAGSLIPLIGDPPHYDYTRQKIAIVCVNVDGTIRWQKRLTDVDPPCPGEEDQWKYGPDTSHNGYMPHVFPDGHLLLQFYYGWCNGVHTTVLTTLSSADGSLLNQWINGGANEGLAAVMTDGTLLFAWADPEGYWMEIEKSDGARFDKDPFGVCHLTSSMDLPLVWENEEFTALEVTDVIEETDPYAVFNDTHTTDFRDLTDETPGVMVCGDSWPGIQSVKVLRDPFRLKLVGWNFEAGAEVRVNGISVPSTKYKGTDHLNRTRLSASGRGLKGLVPKGEAVTLTVVNPDGKESVAFRFAR